MARLTPKEIASYTHKQEMTYSQAIDAENLRQAIRKGPTNIKVLKVLEESYLIEDKDGRALEIRSSAFEVILFPNYCYKIKGNGDGEPITVCKTLGEGTNCSDVKLNFDLGMFYCPYVPLQMTRKSLPRVKFKSRYGLIR